MSRTGPKPLLLSAVLFAAIFVLRATVGSVGDAISFLYVVPVVIVAVAGGVRAGLIAGGVGFALSSLGSIAGNLPVTPLGYVNRALVYLFIGGLIGRFADRLRAAEAESARHFELSRDMICVAGFDGYFKRVNPEFERRLGFSERELLAKPFIEFVHPEDRERTESEAVAISDGSGAAQFQNRYLDKRGAIHWIEWTSVGIPAENLIYAVARDITDRKEVEAELQRLSQLDPLTGLLNRRSFEEALERQLTQTRHHRRGGAVLVIDLDRFKQINDEFGHATGDDALCKVAATLSANLREGDTVARGSDSFVGRLGGDEFALLLPEAGAAGAEAVGRRLIEALASVPLRFDGREVQLGVSIGIAPFGDEERQSPRDLLAAADRAMYLAKAAGGGGVVLAATEV